MAVRKITHGRGTSYEATLKVHGKVVRRRYPTRKAALDFYARTRAEAAAGTFVPVDRGRISFAEFTGQWLAARHRSRVHQPPEKPPAARLRADAAGPDHPP
jgi:hypothetical protein